jgi:hypothetical protein
MEDDDFYGGAQGEEVKQEAEVKEETHGADEDMEEEEEESDEDVRSLHR